MFFILLKILCFGTCSQEVQKSQKSFYYFRIRGSKWSFLSLSLLVNRAVSDVAGNNEAMWNGEPERCL